MLQLFILFLNFWSQQSHPRFANHSDMIPGISRIFRLIISISVRYLFEGNTGRPSPWPHDPPMTPRRGSDLAARLGSRRSSWKSHGTFWWCTAPPGVDDGTLSRWLGQKWFWDNHPTSFFLLVHIYIYISYILRIEVGFFFVGGGGVMDGEYHGRSFSGFQRCPAWGSTRRAGAGWAGWASRGTYVQSWDVMSRRNWNSNCYLKSSEKSIKKHWFTKLWTFRSKEFEFPIFTWHGNICPLGPSFNKGRRWAAADQSWLLGGRLWKLRTKLW